MVRINGARIDAASRAVRAGDVVTVALDRVRVLRVSGFSERRGRLRRGVLLYDDLSPAPASARQTAGRRPRSRPAAEQSERRDFCG